MRKPSDQVKFLIVEDDQEKREKLVKIVKELGYKLDNIERTKYAEEAVDLINDDQPDVVLLDLKLPYSKENEKIKLDNSNKVIEAVERLNVIRNQETDSTGIIVISASIDDQGLQKRYKNTKEIVAFFDKDEIVLDEENFKHYLAKKVNLILERDFNHPSHIDWKEIRLAKLKKLEPINQDLYNRVRVEVLGQLEKLNNKGANQYLISRSIIGMCGLVVEDIINLISSNVKSLTQEKEEDNFRSVRQKLTELTGRKWNNDDKSYSIKGEPVFTRKSAEYARIAYMLRSEALHTKENDEKNNKLFVDSDFAVEDAIVSVSLIMPILHEYIEYKIKK